MQSYDVSIDPGLIKKMGRQKQQYIKLKEETGFEF